MSTSDDLAARLATGLIEEAGRRTLRLEALLTRLEQLAEWEESEALPTDLRALVRDARVGQEATILDLLRSWRRLGGHLGFLSAEAERKPEPSKRLVLPAPEEEPTERIATGRLSAAHNGPAPALDALEGLKADIEGGGAFQVQPPPADWPQRLSEQLRHLGTARDLDTELTSIIKVVDALERWRVVPPEVQATLIGLIAARLRSLQELPNYLTDRKVDFAFGALSAYVKRARPGFVYGLARWHTPTRESWDADADALFERLSAVVPEPTEPQSNAQKHLDLVERLVKEVDLAPAEARSAVVGQLRREVGASLSAGIPSRNLRLVHALLPHHDALEGTEFRALRRAIREELQDPESEEETEEDTVIPSTWGWWDFTRGRRALIVGGDPREQSRERLERAFAFGSLEWIGAEFKGNNLSGVRDRFRAGKTDMVILLTRFTGIDAGQIVIPACREAGVPFVCVPHGYGIGRVRQAIERFLDPEGKR